MTTSLTRPVRLLLVVLVVAGALGGVVAALPRVRLWKAAKDCRKGDLLGCELGCELGDVRACLEAADWLDHSEHLQKRERALALVGRACTLGSQHACNGALARAGDDPRRGAWEARACELGLPASCAHLAREALARDPRIALVMHDRVCTLRDRESCERIAGEALARDPDLGLVMYERHCRERGTEAERHDCSSQWRARIQEVKLRTRSCDAQERGACTSLGRLLFFSDEDATLAAFAAECTLRGLSGLYHPRQYDPSDANDWGFFSKWYEKRSTETGAETCGLELLQGDIAAHPEAYPRSAPSKRSSGSESQKQAPPVNPAISFREHARGAVMVAPDDLSLRQAVEGRLSIVEGCLSPSAVSTGLRAGTLDEVRETRRRDRPRRLSGSFVIDRFGEILIEHFSNSDLTQAEHDCIVKVHEAAYPVPSSARKITINYQFDPARSK